MSSQAITLPWRETRTVSLPWLPFLPLLAIPFLGTSPESLDRIIVAMELIFLIMAIRNPVLVLGALLLSELTIRHYYLEISDFRITTRLFISFASLLIVFPHLIRGATLGRKARPLIFLAVSFVALTTVANAVALDVSFVFKFLRYIATGFIALLIIPLVIKTREDLLQVGLLGLIIAASSAVVAVLQYFHFTGAPVIQVVPNGVVPTGFEDWDGRSLGLAVNPILLANDLMLFLFPVIAVLLTGGVSQGASHRFSLLILVMAAALLFSQTRSWVLSAAFATAAMALVLPRRVGRELILILLIAAFGFWYWADHSDARYGRGFSDDSSAAARLVLWSASLNVALDNPVLGVGYGQFREFGPQYASTVDPDLLARFDAGNRLGRDNPHNDYLNVWLSFGTGGLVLYLLLFAHTWANLHRAARTLRDPLLRGIALGSLGALVAFAVNSFFHNLFGSTLTLWILAGLSLALMNLAQAPEAPASRSRAVTAALPMR